MTNPDIEPTPPIRVVLPQHLRTLAGTTAEVPLQVAAPVTVRRVLEALEARYPALGGTIREHGTGKRRAFMRIFACGIARRGGRWQRAAHHSWGDCRRLARSSRFLLRGRESHHAKDFLSGCQQCLRPPSS